MSQTKTIIQNTNRVRGSGCCYPKNSYTNLLEDLEDICLGRQKERQCDKRHICSEIYGQIKRVVTLIHNEILDLREELNRQPEKRDSEH